MTINLFNEFSILVGQSYFNAIKRVNDTIICTLYGLGGVAISSATRTLVIICKVYFIAGLRFFITSFRGFDPTNSLSKVDRVLNNIYTMGQKKVTLSLLPKVTIVLKYLSYI